MIIIIIIQVEGTIHWVNNNNNNDYYYYYYPGGKHYTLD